jgi:hypothetical protein
VSLQAEAERGAPLPGGVPQKPSAGDAATDKARADIIAAISIAPSPEQAAELGRSNARRQSESRERQPDGDANRSDNALRAKF